MEEISVATGMQEENQGSHGGITAASLSGGFMDGAHPTSGMALVDANRKNLQLKDFKSESGPILDLYLATDLQATDYVDLGELQGLAGDFTYALPGGINFETHKYLIVWCVDFSVNFGYAVLE